MLEWTWGKPLLENFNNSPQKGYTEIEPDAGLPFRRLKFSDITDLANCNFILSRSDYIRFMSWYKYELKQGTEPFEIWDCRYKIKRVARLVGDVPQYSTNSNYYNMSVTIAFNSAVEVIDFALAVDDDVVLVVNNNDVLLGGRDLRV